jgi:hypothetical protein
MARTATQNRRAVRRLDNAGFELTLDDFRQFT